MTTRTRRGRLNFLMEQVQRQHTWIEEHGRSLSGYVARYGSKDDPDHYGDGGEAIYKADTDALHRYQQEYAAAVRSRR